MTEQAPLDFYFDFSSPYGYFAAEGLEDVVAPYGRSVVWHPILIGVAMQQTGAQPLASVPVKGDYMVHDCNRLARFMEVPWQVPDEFPMGLTQITQFWSYYGSYAQEPPQSLQTRPFD